MASGKKLQGITIEIDGNTTKLSDSLKNVNKTIAATSSELKNINGLLKLDPSNTVLLNQKQQVLAETIKATAEKLQQLKQAQKDADTSGVDKNTDSYRELEREIIATEKKLNSLENDLKDTDKALDDNTNSIKDLKDAEDKAGQGAIKFGDLIKANLLSSAIKKGIETLTNSMKKLGSSIIGLGKDAVNSYADYEQLVGGIETLFGEDNASKVIENAQKAYKNAGLSANEYMDTITSFSASLISSLGGDTKKATSYADSAIKDMSDNANKMGTDISSIQNAYQGFAKQNYTMLDNLKLGYGGTKTEMERLIADANKVKKANGEMANLSINSFADVTEAIHIIQNEMGITGTTAQEAGTTITGSVNAMKSAWSNLVTGLADGNSNMEQLITDFVTTIVGDGSENNRGVIGNILPVILELVKQIPKLISTLIPELVPVVIEIITELCNALLDNLPLIVDAIITMFEALMELLTNPDMIEKLVAAAIYLTIEFAVALVKAVPEIIKKLPQIIGAIFKGLGEGIAKTKWGSIGLDILKGLLNGMLDFGNIVKDTIKKVGNKITGAIKSFFGIKSPSRLMKKEVGKYLAQGIAVGFEDEIPSTIDDVQNAMKELNTGIQASVNPTINPQANTNPLIIQIENFNNQRDTDIQALAEELEFYRKNSALAVGGN